MKPILFGIWYWISRIALGLTVFVLDLSGVILSIVLMALEALTSTLASWSFDLTNLIARKDKEHGR